MGAGVGIGQGRAVLVGDDVVGLGVIVDVDELAIIVELDGVLDLLCQLLAGDGGGV